MEPPVSIPGNGEPWEDNMAAVAQMGNAANKCSSVLEGVEVNVELTAPGALIALALMHLRSGD